MQWVVMSATLLLTRRGLEEKNWVRKEELTLGFPLISRGRFRQIDPNVEITSSRN